MIVRRLYSAEHLRGSRNAGRRAGMSLVELIVVICVIGLLVAVLVPAIHQARDAVKKSRCKKNLKGIGLALLNYHETYRCFPPAQTVGRDGQRLHSWRTVILPYLEQQALYDQTDLSQPWNDPVNSKAYETNLEVFQCEHTNLLAQQTTYLAVLSPASLFGISENTENGKLPPIESESQQILVIEADLDNAVHWMAPRDTTDEYVLQFGSDTSFVHYDFDGNHATNALFTDGSVRFVQSDMPAAERLKMLYANNTDEHKDSGQPSEQER